MPRRRRPPIATQAPYGQGERLADAQRQMPVAAPPPVAAPSSAGPPQPAAAGGGGMAAAIEAAALMAPPSDGGLIKPTARPGEPVTTGLDIGAGPGMGKIGMPLVPEDDEALKTLMLVYQRSGDPEVGRLIELVRGRSDARRRTLSMSNRKTVAAADRRPL